MRTALIIFLCPLICFSQISITDDFSDGDFSNNPVWIGDSAKFVVNGAYELQLNDVAAGSAYLSTSSQIADNASWNFRVRMDFNPSSSNYAKVYLLSDQSDLSGSINGYYVRLGGSSADRISLYRQDGNVSTVIAESGDDWLDVAAVDVSIKVTRDSLGLWMLAADTLDGVNYVALDSVVDSTYSSSQFMGIQCNYTATRADKFFFDDFNLTGKAYFDLAPPSIISLDVLDSTGLKLQFSEALDSATANDISNYQVNGSLGLPIYAVLNHQDSTEVELRFSSVIQINKRYYLYLSGIKDLFGNVLNDTLDFMRYKAQANQIIITELMVDPSPVVGIPPNALPEREYVEIYNRSGFSINLFGWVLQTGSSGERLAGIELGPGEYLLITKDDGVSEFPPGISVMGLDMSSTALTNSGTTVSLLSPVGVLVNTVSYTDEWYHDPNKENGGWSLELIDTGNFCGGKENWSASASSVGGTPGLINSVNGKIIDTISPVISRVAILGDSTIGIYFSKRMDESMLGDSLNYSINPKLNIKSVNTVFPKVDRVIIKFAEKIEEGVSYQLWFNDLISDCSGNIVTHDTVIFAIPEVPAVGEVLINEVLFNPYSQGSDFVELYNYSDKVFDLGKLLLGNWNEMTNSVENPIPISDESFLFGPGEYAVISEDIGFLRANYVIRNPKALVESSAVPSMPDDEGSVAVVTSDLKTVCDYVKYSDDMQLQVLQSDEGVSLERISFSKSTQDRDNWHSAAEGVGFATPGYKNSMAYQGISKGEVTIDPKVFSPNQDGYHDILNINYSFARPGNVLTLSVWNSRGLLVRKLQENTNVGQEGFFTWDGTDDNSRLMNSGIYIIVLEYFNVNGDSEVFKETCVLSL